MMISPGAAAAASAAAAAARSRLDRVGAALVAAWHQLPASSVLRSTSGADCNEPSALLRDVRALAAAASARGAELQRARQGAVAAGVAVLQHSEAESGQSLPVRPAVGADGHSTSAAAAAAAARLHAKLGRRLQRAEAAAAAAAAAAQADSRMLAAQHQQQQQQNEQTVQESERLHAAHSQHVRMPGSQVAAAAHYTTPCSCPAVQTEALQQERQALVAALQAAESSLVASQRALAEHEVLLAATRNEAAATRREVDEARCEAAEAQSATQRVRHPQEEEPGGYTALVVVGGEYKSPHTCMCTCTFIVYTQV